MSDRVRSTDASTKKAARAAKTQTAKTISGDVTGAPAGELSRARRGRITPVKGTIKTTYTVAHGAEILCGGTWQGPPAGLDLVKTWIKRLRH